KPYWLLERIDLGYRANILSLDFGALDFASPKRNRLAYRMTGLTDRWLDLGTQRRITLTNIESGDHLLEVRAANSDSVWSGTPLKLTIHRDPPPWKSWWACIGYALAVLVLIAYRVRLQRLKFQQVLDARAAADRQRPSGPVEDQRRQDRARGSALRSRPGSRGVREPLRGRRPGEGHRAHRLAATARARLAARGCATRAADPDESDR